MQERDVVMLSVQMRFLIVFDDFRQGDE